MTAAKTNEPNHFEVIASFSSKANTKLARAVYPILSWASYDRYQAHTWALRLIKAAPQNGEDCAAALINFDYMVPAARSKSRRANTKGQSTMRCMPPTPNG